MPLTSWSDGGGWCGTPNLRHLWQGERRVGQCDPPQSHPKVNIKEGGDGIIRGRFTKQHAQDQTRRFLRQRRPPPGSAASHSPSAALGGLRKRNGRGQRLRDCPGWRKRRRKLGKGMIKISLLSFLSL